MGSTHRCLACIFATSVVMFLAPPAKAQFTGRYAVTQSFDPSAADASTSGGIYSPADILVVNSTAAGGGGVQWSEGNLGVPPGGNIDAFSDGTDVLPPTTATCTEILIDYTVDASAIGSGTGSLITLERATDGAMSDVFAKVFSGSTEVLEYLESDHDSIHPSSDIDALAWLERGHYPVYFSVDVATATAMSALLGFLVTEGDILTIDKKASMGGMVTIFKPAAELGLVPGDDVDAIAVDTSRYNQIVFSLTPTSPSLLAGGSYAGTSPGDLLVHPLATTGTGNVWMSAAALDLSSGDNLNGVRITDPQPGFMTSGSEPSFGTPDPWNFESLTIDGYSGNAGKEVWMEASGLGHFFQIKTQVPGDIALLFAYPGQTCNANGVYLPIAKGWLSFLPLGPPLLIVVPGQNPVQIPIPANLLPGGFEVNFQGVVHNPAGTKVFTTNAVTLKTF